jgi:nucleotide-binding universal stress UspA family protein
MFKTILVPTDGSPLSDKVITAAVDFAKQVGGSIVGLSVVEPYPFSPFSERAMTEDTGLFEDQAREVAQESVQKIANAARAANVPCETVISPSGTPHGEIIDVAKNMKCDVIFMASHGRKGISRLFVGSETQKVLADAPVPVMVFR